MYIPRLVTRSVNTLRFSFFALILNALMAAGCSTVGELVQQNAAVGSGGVAVSLPYTLDIVTVDGERLRSPSLISGSYKLFLSEGYHHISLRYSDNWNAPDQAANNFTSLPVELSAEFKLDGVYLVDHLPINSAQEAELFSRDPEIWLLDEGNQKKILAKKIDASRKPLLGRLSNIAVSTPTDEDAQFEDGLEADKEVPESERLKSLKALWQNASEEEQKAFWMWIRSVPQ